jgi:hypothetical protein
MVSMLFACKRTTDYAACAVSARALARGRNMEQRLIVPVYLNQRIVFDLLAMLEGGVSHVTRIGALEQTRETTQGRFGAEFGLTKAFAALFSIGVKGDLSKEAAAGNAVSRDEERIHTPASLFYQLRNRLQDSGALTRIEAGYVPRARDLVEFDASLVRNPLIQTMDSFLSLMEMAVAFTDEPGGGKASQKASGAKPDQKSTKRENERLVQQMRVFREKLAEGGSIDVVARGIAGDYQAVITLESEYLNDPSMADLVDGTFTVVGKITNVVAAGAKGISLLRRSALTVMPPAIISGMSGSLTELADKGSFNLPELWMEVPAPAFQVIPVAVFA